MSSIEIHKNSITHISTDIIVNAANSSLAEGGGVCGAIFSAAGSSKLARECAKYGHCKTGGAVITSACDMKNAKYIVHAVGPIYSGGTNGEPEQLYSCYKESLILARDNHCRSIGFPLISSGIFGYPHDEAWKIALSACKDFINENPEYDISIVFVSTNRDMVEQGKQILAKLNEVKIPDCRLLTKYLRIQDWSSCRYAESFLIEDIDYVAQNNKELDLIHYEDILEKHGIEWSFDSMSKADADTLDAVTILALLVAAYRADHFSNGTFEEFIDNGSVQRWLERLSRITPSC